MKRLTWFTGAAAVAAASVLSLSLLSAGTPASAHPTAVAAHSASHPAAPKPTVVLVHGAWADASGWTDVIERLEKAGYPVVAPPNPLRGVSSDSAYLASYLAHISGPIVLVGHSYGGEVITNAATGNPKVKALVYIAGWAPDQGETLGGLIATKLGSEIPGLPLIQTAYTAEDGTQGAEFTIDPAKYRSVFLDDELPAPEAQAMAAEQRPLGAAAVTGVSGVPAWKTIPSWYLVAKQDRAISPDLERFMAKRAHAHIIEVNAPHLAMVTDPKAVTALIETAAVSTAH